MERLRPAPDHQGLVLLDKHTDGPAVGGSKCAAAASKVAGAPLGSCRFVSMDATAKPSFCYDLDLKCNTFNVLTWFPSKLLQFHFNIANTYCYVWLISLN